jgi:hypothetical protein
MNRNVPQRSFDLCHLTALLNPFTLYTDDEHD